MKIDAKPEKQAGKNYRQQTSNMIESLESRICLSSASPAWNVARPALALSGIDKSVVVDSDAPASNAFTPSQIATAYGINQIRFGSAVGNGTGQTIAIIDPYNDPDIISDLAAFDTQFKLVDNTVTQVGQMLHVVNQTGGSTLPIVDDTDGSWEVEESLDVEWAHAIAPGAKLLLVECNSANFSDLIAGGVNYARKQPGVSVVSMSFAGGEAPQDLAFDSYFTTPANHAGVTFVAATGDTAPDAGYPAVCPNVVAVGGTNLFTSNSSGTYSSETGASYEGGGISSYELQPGYQKSVVTENNTFRTTPDVVFDGTQATGVAVYDSYDGGVANPWRIEGGSSLATPCWAGLIAIADQGRSVSKLAALDGATGTLPRLYNLPSSDFNVISQGNNGFSAGTGYNLVTGLGSPIANKLVAGLCYNAAGPLVTSYFMTGISSSKVTSASFTFSQAMNTSSFSINSDVETFTGPGGVSLLKQITSYKWLNSDLTLQLNFDSLTTNGAYRLVLGPNVEASGSNQKLDQNFNGVAGDSRDIYTARFTIASSVGPNMFGYTASAASYQNVSLTAGATGVTSILANTDDGSQPVSLGTNTFNFYGKNYNSLYVDSNGFLTFGAGSTANTDYANDDLTSDPSNPTIAPLWDDWTTNRAATEMVLYKFTNPSSSGVPGDLVIEWDAVQNQGAIAQGSANPATFEVVLQLNTGAKAGNIVFNYANLNLGQSNFNNGGSATVGISDGSLSFDVLLVSLDNPNNPLIGTGKSILIDL